MILEWSIILGAGEEKIYKFSYKAYALVIRSSKKKEHKNSLKSLTAVFCETSLSD